MNELIRLSYYIDEDTPLYPGTPALEIRKAKAIGKGDFSNTHIITFSNHSGTHIEMPKHFFDSGKGIKDYSSHRLAYNSPLIVDCPRKPDEMIEAEDLAHAAIDDKTDALLIRTGFYKYRISDAAAYCGKNPYLSPEAAGWIMQNLLNLKIVGIDAISISSKAHRPLGAEAHKILLTDQGGGRGPVFILEDLCLPAELKSLNGLFVFPIFGADIDGSPCTVIGILND